MISFWSGFRVNSAGMQMEIFTRFNRTGTVLIRVERIVILHHLIRNSI